MDKWCILQIKQTVQRLRRHGVDAPAISALLGLLQFAILIGLFVKLWLVQDHGMSGPMLATMTIVIVGYLLETSKSIRAQIVAYRGLAQGRARDYQRQVRKTRRGQAVSRLLTLGLAIGAVSAVPEMLEHFGAPAFFETSGIIAVFIADAVRQYCSCIVPMA